jgi:hypothetical protein
MINFVFDSGHLGYMTDKNENCVRGYLTTIQFFLASKHFLSLAQIENW